MKCDITTNTLPPPPSRAWRRGGVQEAARGMYSVRIRDAVSSSTPGLFEGTATTLRDGASHQHHLPPATQFATSSTLLFTQSSDGAAVGSDPRVEEAKSNKRELMNRGSLRPCSTPTPWSAACMPRCQLIGRRPGIALCGDSILARESAGSPLLLATADARPRGLGCMFRRLRGHMVRCARGRAGRRNARQTRPGFFFPPAANRKRRETNNCSIGKPSSCRRPSRWHGEWLPPTAVRFFVTDHASF